MGSLVPGARAPATPSTRSGIGIVNPDPGGADDQQDSTEDEQGSHVTRGEGPDRETARERRETAYTDPGPGVGQ
jgi:hypothetical protein